MSDAKAGAKPRKAQRGPAIAKTKPVKAALPEAVLPEAASPKIPSPKAAVAKAANARRVIEAVSPPAPAAAADPVPAPLPPVVTAPAAALAETAAELVESATESATAATLDAALTPGEIAETIEAAVSPADLRETVSDATAAVQQAPAKMMEGRISMATVTNETAGIASEKLQALFGDFGARFKAGFDKSTKLGEELADLAKGNVEAVVASARVAAKGSEALGQEAADYGKKNLETIVAALKGFASVKSPTELFQLQSDFAKAQFDSAVAEASRLSESVMKLAGDVAQPLSSRYAVAAEKIKAATL